MDVTSNFYKELKIENKRKKFTVYFFFQGAVLEALQIENKGTHLNLELVKRNKEDQNEKNFTDMCNLLAQSGKGVTCAFLVVFIRLLYLCFCLFSEKNWLAL